MAVQLTLPEPAGLPSRVLFHREHPSEPVLILQVPNPGATDSETYVVRLDREEHRAWINALPGSRWLLDMLQMEMHVLYETASGAIQAVPDLDMPGPFQETFHRARAHADRDARMERFYARRDRRQYPQSRLRLQLGAYRRGH